MATDIQPGASVSGEITSEISVIDNFLDELKEDGADQTQKKLEQLLIEYILANMSGDSAKADAIGAQITSLLKTSGSETLNANALIEQLHSIELTPTEQTSSVLQQLQNLGQLLQTAVSSNDPGALMDLPSITT